MNSSPHQETIAAALCGIGSPHGTDQLGWRMIDRAAGRLPAEVVPIRVAKPVDLLELSITEALWIVDLCVLPADHPTDRLIVRRWPEKADLSDRSNWTSAHGWSPLNTLMLMETLGRLPRQVTIALVALHDAPDPTQSAELEEPPTFSCLEQELLYLIDDEWQSSNRYSPKFAEP